MTKSMKKTFSKKIFCAVIICTFSVFQFSFAQLNWQKGGNNALPPGSPPTLGTNYNAPLQFLTNGTERARFLAGNGFLGIGQTNTFVPLSLLHVNSNGLATGEVFRTNGPAANLNAWRLFTGAGNGNEKGMIFNYGTNPIVADQTNFSLQASVSDMSFYTLPITANTVGTERMRIVGVNRWQGSPIFATVRNFKTENN